VRDQVIDLVIARGLMPFLDMAYQGFGDGIAEDAWSMRALAAAGVDIRGRQLVLEELLAVWRARRRAERGVRQRGTAARVLGQLKATVRRNYSSPPAHGARSSAASWLRPPPCSPGGRTGGMRARMWRMREQLAPCRNFQGRRSFASWSEQRGMFSYTGLSPAQVDFLRKEFGIYLVRSGRICMAGLNENNLAKVARGLSIALARAFPAAHHETSELSCIVLACVGASASGLARPPTASRCTA
jgi:aromatic-amino-acid transaminase